MQPEVCSFDMASVFQWVSILGPEQQNHVLKVIENIVRERANEPKNVDNAMKNEL